jgi:hypothetical protein
MVPWSYDSMNHIRGSGVDVAGFFEVQPPRTPAITSMEKADFMWYVSY